MTLAFVILIGLVFGSFLNVLIARIPHNENVAFPASHCPKCKTPLKIYHNIPLFSWLFLRGKCAFCKEKISIQYPIVELLSGIIFGAVFFKLGFGYMALMISLSFSFLLALSVIDFYIKMVPDSLNLLAMTTAMMAALSLEGFVINFQHTLLFVGGFALLRFYLSYFMKREALGEGDLMVAGTMGAMVGIQLGLMAIFVSALLALPIMLIMRNETDESKMVPFVPFLAMALFIVYIFDFAFIEYWNNLYG
ncbi:prepilin peptidase [Sulfurimonas sp. MAG313]|nr:A24 family peptidase [Sulfurimonas sp. MAG313]MDF1879790.1 prepilin peptidase [Sulfurimonas sp. MAG313]